MDTATKTARARSTGPMTATGLHGSSTIDLWEETLEGRLNVLGVSVHPSGSAGRGNESYRFDGYETSRLYGVFREATSPLEPLDFLHEDGAYLMHFRWHDRTSIRATVRTMHNNRDCY